MASCGSTTWECSAGGGGVGPGRGGRGGGGGPARPAARRGVVPPYARHVHVRRAYRLWVAHWVTGWSNGKESGLRKGVWAVAPSLRSSDARMGKSRSRNACGTRSRDEGERIEDRACLPSVPSECRLGFDLGPPGRAVADLPPGGPISRPWPGSPPGGRFLTDAREARSSQKFPVKRTRGDTSVTKRRSISPPRARHHEVWSVVPDQRPPEVHLTHSVVAGPGRPSRIMRRGRTRQRSDSQGDGRR